nr:hypothetical protein [Spirosomataceae bacterium]
RIAQPQTLGFFEENLEVPNPLEEASGVEILKNHPNPFDESTYVILRNDSGKRYGEAYLTVRKGDGSMVERRRIEVGSGINEYLFDYKNEGRIEVLYCTFEADGKILATRRMVIRH